MVRDVRKNRTFELMGTGAKLKMLFKLYRLTPEEVAVEAKMSTANLQKVFKDKASEDATRRVTAALESCRLKLLTNLQSKTG